MMKIQVVGPGCANCEKLRALCEEVVTEKRLNAQIEKIDDIDRFMELGVFLTPALLIDGELKVSGKIPTKSTLQHWLLKAAEKARP